VIYRSSLWAIGLASALALTPSPAAGQSADSTTLPSPVEELVREARTHEKARRWEEAIQSWFRVLNLDRANLEARESIPKDVRLALQSHRHRDPAFQARVLAMSPADVLTLYEEVLAKVQEHYVDSDKVTTARLFRQGFDEFLAALSDPHFIELYLKGVDETAIARFRANVQKAWAGREIVTNRQAMTVVAEIAAAAKKMLGLRTINPVVGEFICGACNSLDEYSAYLSASQYAAESIGSMQLSVQIRLEEGDVAYLRITHFQPTTPQEVENALKNLAGTVRAIVLDLRGNTGGFFPAAVKTAEKFLPGGIIVTAQGQHESASKVYNSTAGNSAIDLPMIVLVDGETASAAEVLAVALRDNRRAKLIGTATFGKGTVQKVVTFTTAEEVDTESGKPQPRAAVRITQARLIAPSGGPITGVGVTPDQLIPDRERQFSAALEQAKELARRYMGMMNGMGMRMGD
jgi:C-terminal processing protease CtpA/Prc